jgi:hypothetical protein
MYLADLPAWRIDIATHGFPMLSHDLAIINESHDCLVVTGTSFSFHVIEMG